MAPTPSSAVSVTSSDDLDYEVISDPGPDIELSIPDLSALSFAGIAQHESEPQPLPLARERFFAATMSAEEVQAYVRKLLPSEAERRTMRVYVDGVFDTFHVGTALQLRQAKLSFPSVHLMVGVFADVLCQAQLPQVERCELLRHCRWVDEVVPEAPWTLDEAFLSRRRIDYVALEEGITVDPACDKARLKGYDLVKGLGKVIPTRRTSNITANTGMSTVSSPLVSSQSTFLMPPLIPTPVLPPVAAPTTSPIHIPVHAYGAPAPRSPSQQLSPSSSSTPPSPSGHMDMYGIGI